MANVFSFSSGPRAKWVVFFVWIVAVIGCNVAGLPEKFTDAEENESSSFLPADAESTKALAITEELNDGDVAPTVIVYRRGGGLTPADRSKIEEDTGKLNELTKEYENTTPFGEPTVSRDGTTALVQNQIKGTGEAPDILDPIDDYREAVSDPGGGLEVKVAGPAGVSADAIKVFEGINGTLLLAAGGLVIFLLIFIYRSPVFWFFPILAVVVAEISARGFGYGLAEAGVTVNGQSSAILSILVIGAGTDYALLLVARYREELRRTQDKHVAMAEALRRAGPAIFASGLTVMTGLLVLTLADVNGTAGLGPIGAMGVGVALLVMLTFLPALLTIVGRKPFYPFIPYGPETPAEQRKVSSFGPIGRLQVRDRGREVDETHGFWRRVGDRVARHPHRTALISAGVLGVMCLGLLNYSNGLTQGNSFRDEVESIQGQDLIAEAFPQGQSAPTDIVVRDPSKVAEVARAAASVEGVAEVPPRPAQQGEAGVQLLAFLEFPPYTTQAFEVVEPLREAVRRVDPGALVGGPTAIESDLRDASARDTRLLIPLTLAIVFLILVVLLRSLIAPVVLIATVVLSFLASLGVGAVVFDVIFGFPGASPEIPLFAFIFLVALGVDYNIFLMTRVREEALKHGTRDGMLRGLAVTGGVITAAGIVLAGTFAVLGVLPLVFLTELGFLVGFGVLLDTFIVRSVLVPAITFELGPKIWWPSSLASSLHNRKRPPAPPTAPPSGPREPEPALD